MSDFPAVHCSMGSYDFCHPSDKQMHYSFRLPDDAPAGLIRAASTDENGQATDDPIEAAQMLVDHGESMLYCGNLDRYRELLAYLKEHEEPHTHARLLARREKLEKQLAAVNEELLYYEQETAPAL